LRIPFRTVIRAQGAPKIRTAGAPEVAPLCRLKRVSQQLTNGPNLTITTYQTDPRLPHQDLTGKVSTRSSGGRFGAAASL